MDNDAIGGVTFVIHKNNLSMSELPLRFVFKAKHWEWLVKPSPLYLS